VLLKRRYLRVTTQQLLLPAFVTNKHVYHSAVCVSVYSLYYAVTPDQSSLGEEVRD